MKKLMILVGCLAFSAVAFSQSNAIKANLLSPIVKVGNFQYERVLNDKSSIQLGVFFGKVGGRDTDASASTFGITPEYRMYLGENSAPDGFFVAPFFRYRSFTLKNNEPGFEAEGTLSLTGGGLLVGRQWLFSEKVTFELFIGPQYSGGSIKVKEGNEDDLDLGLSFDGFGVRAGLSLGFAF